MAGAGSRFVSEGYSVPKQLIMVDNRHMIDISLDCIDKKDYNLIFCVRSEQITNFSIDKILKKRYGNDIKIVEVDHLTDGSVSTCLLAEKYINNDLPLLIYTLDVFFEPKFSLDQFNNSDGLILTFKSNNDSYSYAKTDENGYVTQTAEKNVISEEAAVGVYAFKKGSTFVKYAKQMIKKDLRTKGEFYICPLYNLMIDGGLKIKTKFVEKMHLMGTPNELDFFTSHALKKFNNKPIALCCDHSGYDLKNSAIDILTEKGIKYIDFGCYTNKDCDYNDYAKEAIKRIEKNECDFGLGFCRTGQGINIFANKSKNIRSALVFDDYTAEYSVRHNCANFFAIPSKYINSSKLKSIINIISKSSFDGGRHIVRLQKTQR